jgi:hypothetical protein
VLCFSVSIWLTMENSKAAGFKTLNHSKMLPIWQIAHLSHYHRKKKNSTKECAFCILAYIRNKHYNTLIAKTKTQV